MTIFWINRVIISNAQNEIVEALNALNERQNRDGSIDSRVINEVNKRMTVELYDGNNNLVANLGVFGIEREGELKTGEFTLIAANYFAEEEPFSPATQDKVYLLVYQVEVDWLYVSNNNPGPNQGGRSEVKSEVKVVDFYMDVSSELNIRSRMITIFIVSIVSTLFLAFFATFLVSRYAMKPIAEAFQKQTDFVSDASHELRTPLAIVQSKLENILSKSDSTILDVSDDIVITLNEVIRLSKLTNNLLTLSRSDREKIALELVEEDIYKLVLQTAEPFVEIAAMNGKKINFSCEEVVGLIDKDKINQVLVIFLDNALRYTDEGDTIEIRLKKGKDEFILSVADTGIGISNETKQHMFDRFYREDKARNRDTGGRGLGLAIAKALVNVCNGKISADHNTPKGTIMTIVIPLSSVKENKNL